jgi:nucleoside-diphosphate-sugar epimerase
MRVLVIGGTGFIGSHVVRLLFDGGHTVAAFHRPDAHAALPRSVARIHGDRSRLASSRDELLRFAADVVIDMRALNEAGAEMLVEVFEGKVARTIVASSADVYRARDRLCKAQVGPPDPVPLREDAPLRETRFPYRAKAPDKQHRHYSYDKILVEEVVKRLDATVLRLPAVFGPGDHQHRLFEYLQPMLDGRDSIILDEELARWRWTRGYVVNVAHCFAPAISNDRARGRIYNVGDDALTERAWVESIGRAYGWKGTIVEMPRAKLPPLLADDVNAYDLAQDWVTDIERARSELGYHEVIDAQEALKATVAWEIAHPPEAMPTRDYAAEDRALATAGLKVFAGGDIRG